jgi:hypothetical protein
MPIHFRPQSQQRAQCSPRPRPRSRLQRPRLLQPHCPDLPHRLRRRRHPIRCQARYLNRQRSPSPVPLHSPPPRPCCGPLRSPRRRQLPRRTLHRRPRRLPTPRRRLQPNRLRRRSTARRRTPHLRPPMRPQTARWPRWPKQHQIRRQDPWRRPGRSRQRPQRRCRMPHRPTLHQPPEFPVMPDSSNTCAYRISFQGVARAVPPIARIVHMIETSERVAGHCLTTSGATLLCVSLQITP